MKALALMLWSATATAACPPLTPDGLAALARSKGAPLNVVFFSSWCSACKDKLTGAHDAKTILVGSFDKTERIERVIAALKPNAPCYMDAGITDALGVASLPKTVVYKP